MPSILNARLLSAVMLAALLLCALGAPVENEPTDSPAGDLSGEEEEQPSSAPSLSKTAFWDLIVNLIEGLTKEFQDELQATDSSLNNYKISSLPANCPGSNSNKEACLRWMAEGLETYMVFLKYVEREYPNTSSLSDIRQFSGYLMSQIKQEMSKPGKIKVLTSSEKEQLLKDIDHPHAFNRKMTALSILRQLRDFLCDGKRKIHQGEMSKYQKNDRNNSQL
ncbi:interleukin-6-like [Trachinotus anak]|uniref:interleukin-6-like n=1 Tax=Trachinotus anak TaxID=443729 RepID=UPI0039F1FC6E